MNKKEFSNIKDFSKITQKIKRELIGKKVYKYSKNPFKSKLITATIKDIIEHPQTKESAFTFEEDDSYVSVIQCCLLENKKIVQENNFYLE